MITLNKKQLIKQLDLVSDENFDKVIRDLKVAGVVEEISKEVYKYSHINYLLFIEFD